MQARAQKVAAANMGMRMLRELKLEWGTSMMVIGVWIFFSRRRSLYMDRTSGYNGSGFNVRNGEGHSKPELTRFQPQKSDGSAINLPLIPPGRKGGDTVLKKRARPGTGSGSNRHYALRLRPGTGRSCCQGTTMNGRIISLSSWARMWQCHM